MGETLLHHQGTRVLDCMRQLVISAYENGSRIAGVATAAGVLALGGCATPQEAVLAEATSTPAAPTVEPTAMPTTEAPSPIESTPPPVSTPSPSEQAPQAGYEVPPKYAEAKAMSEKKFIKQNPETKSQFLQGITHDLVTGSKAADKKLKKQIVEALEEGYAPWMATAADDPQVLMNRLSVLQKTAKLLYLNGDRKNAQKVISMLDVRPGGVYEYAEDPFWGSGMRAEHARDNVLDPTILINSYHPDWGGDEPLAFDYEWLQERGGDAACAAYDGVLNPDGIQYNYFAVREEQEGPDAKYNSVVMVGIYAPVLGVAQAYYNPTSEMIPESGKFSLPQYYNNGTYRSGVGSVWDWDMVIAIMPPEVGTQQATLSYTPGVGPVICDWSESKWLGGLKRIK